MPQIHSSENLDHQDPERGVDVFVNDLDGIRAELRYLSQEEKRRSESFRFEIDRQRFIAARTWIRQLLGSALDFAPESIEIDLDESQKPFVRNFPLHFNLSHSGPHATIALCGTHPVGIDIERPMPPGEAMELRHVVCSAGELVALEASPDPDAHFLKIWTAKEALLKGLGTGFQTSPTTISIQENGAFSHAESSDPSLDLSNWKLVSHPGPEGSLITVAVPGEATVTFHLGNPHNR